MTPIFPKILLSVLVASLLFGSAASPAPHESVGRASDDRDAALESRVRDVVEKAGELDRDAYADLKGSLLEAGREDLLQRTLEAIVADRRRRGDWAAAAYFHHEAGTNLANVHRFAEAVAALDSSLAALDRSGDEQPLMRGRSHVFLAAIHATLDDLAAAERHLRVGQQILRDRLPPGSAGWAQTWIIAAGLVGDLEGAEAGIEAHLELLDVFSRLEEPRPVQEAWTRHNLGSLYMQILDFVSAESQFRRALQLRAEALGPDNVFAGTTHHEIARARRWRGDFRGARTELSVAIDIYEEQQERPDWVYLGALQDVADLHLWTGDPRRCIELTHRAMEIAAGLASAYPDRARFWLSLGRANLALDRTEDAIQAFERGRTEESSRERPSRRRVFQLRFGLARALGSAGQTGPARERLDALAHDLARELPQARVLAARVDLQRALLSPSRTPEDEEAASRALSALETVLPAAHPDLIAARIEFARHRARHGNFRRAWSLAREAMDEALSLLEDAARIMTEEHALLFSDDLREAQDLQMYALLRMDREDAESLWPRTYQSLLRSRGLVLSEMARRNRQPPRRGRAEWGAARDELASAQADLARLALFPAAADSSYGDLLRAARRRRERAEIRWARQVAQGENASTDETWESIWPALPDSATVISYVRWSGPDSSSGYAAFVAEKCGEQQSLRCVDLGPAAETDAAVADYDAHIRRATTWLRLDPSTMERESQERLVALSERIWRPLALDPHRARRLWIVPDAALHRVPFAALPGRSREFLAEEFEVVHRLSAERDLLRDAQPSVGRGLLLVGGVDYARASDSDRWRGPDVGPFDELPGSRSEVEAIAALCQDRADLAAEVVSGTAATEALVRAEAPGRRILHMATHGFHAPSRDPRRFDTLLRSGVVLAGANRPSDRAADDGLLTAEEISSLPLDTLEWAVISACDSGSGEAWPGEGVVGLQRALLAAGAGTLVASLWPLEDDVGRRFMEPLYRHRLLEGHSTAASIQQARHEILDLIRSQGRSVHPLRWAGFVAIGDWR